MHQALPTLLMLTDKPVGAMPNCFAPIPTDWELNKATHGFIDIRDDLQPLDFAGSPLLRFITTFSRRIFVITSILISTA